MIGSKRSPPGFPHGGGESDGLPHANNEYYSQALTTAQREELQRMNEQVLQTPIARETTEAQTLEAARIATLAERAHLEDL